MITYVCLALFLLFVPALAQANMANYVKNFMNDLENRNAIAYYSQCGVEQDQYTATLIFEMGKKTGLLIERKGETVINLATVEIGGNGPVIQDTHAGVYTYERTRRLVDELVRYRFALLIPVSGKVLDARTSLRVCVNSP